MNEVERKLIEEIVESVAERHEESKDPCTVGLALAWLNDFHCALRRVIVKHEKLLIFIPRPMLSVRSKPDSGSGSAQPPAASRSRAAGQ